MVRVRRIHVPDLTMRLHNLLVESGDKIPRYVSFLSPAPSLLHPNQNRNSQIPPLSLHNRNLKNPANIVADTRYALYEDFVSDGAHTDRLEDYLRAVRQAILRGLENGGSDPLRPLRIAS